MKKLLVSAALVLIGAALAGVALGALVNWSETW